MRAAEIIARIERHLQRAREIAQMDLNDELVFNALAMECFQAVNSAIELGELIISEKNLGFPATYRDIFETLHQNKLISKAVLEKMKKLVFYRNPIAHEYYVMKVSELKEMSMLLDACRALAEAARKAGVV